MKSDFFDVLGPLTSVGRRPSRTVWVEDPVTGRLVRVVDPDSPSVPDLTRPGQTRRWDR